jgi:integrase
MSNRIKTKYPGVYYREAKRLGGKGTEKVYYIVFKKNGKSHEEKVGRQFADDMTPARAAGIRADRVEGKRLSRKDIKELEEAQKREVAQKWTIERLWKEYKANNPGLKGIKTYTSNYNLYIEPNFGKKEPQDILPLDVDRLRLKLLKKRAPQTVQHVLELFRRIVNFGVQKKLCDGLSFKIEMPKVDNLKTEDLNSVQLNNLLKAIEEDFHPHAGQMMKMALFTGMRRGEMFKLKWTNIDFDRGFINIVDPKGGPDQKLPLNDATRDLLNRHIRTGSLFVFPGRNGGQRVNIAKQINRIKKNAGLPKDFRPLHGLRHVYASMLASSGEVGMYTLQKLLTHKDPKMTQRYAHLRDDALKQAAEVAGNIIQNAAKKKGSIRISQHEFNE